MQRKDSTRPNKSGKKCLETSCTSESRLTSIRKETSEVRKTLAKAEVISREDYGRSRAVPFDLGRIVQEAISQMQGTLKDAARRNAPINLQCYLRQVSPVEGDPEEIRNVVIGLIANAVEAMPEGGDLYITAEENAGNACVYIQDSGTSITEELLPKVMDPFFTALSLARAVLKRHNGDLHLESSKGLGTTITIRMPLARRGAGEGKSGVRKKKNMWIMIMEEDPLIRELLFQVLSSKGYNVDTAEALSECFERLRSRPFDLIIAGTVIGDVQGLVRRIRKAAPKTCLALVGELGNGNLSGRVPHGLVDLLIGKPIDMGWTLDRISELLIGRAK